MTNYKELVVTSLVGEIKEFFIKDEEDVQKHRFRVDFDFSSEI